MKLNHSLGLALFLPAISITIGCTFDLDADVNTDQDPPSGGAGAQSTGGTGGQAPDETGGTAGTGGSAGTGGGPSGTGGGAPAECTTDGDCDDAEACVDSHCVDVVYVSPLGSDETGDGTIAAPFKTLANGISVAAGRDKVVRACADAGSYGEKLDMAAFGSGMSVEGSYKCADFSFDASLRARVVAPTSAGHRMYRVESARIAGFELESPDATQAGGSSIALTIKESSGIELHDVVLVAGTGEDGASGASGGASPAQSGTTGTSGGKAKAGTINVVNPGGAGVTTTCNGSVVSTSGAGGYGGAYNNYTWGGDGLASPDVGGGYAGARKKLHSDVCGNGGGGENGSSGGNGTGGKHSGWTFGDGTFQGSSGANGTAGKPGAGGGGGGGARVPDNYATWNNGASGGAGGSGGCGGLAGAGGQGGGASLGIVMIDSEVSISGAITVSTSGAGGAGGTGQTGGAGGGAGPGGADASTANPDSNDDGTPGCAGGIGGDGGNGGNGGGGAAGPSVGIAYTGTAPALGDVTFNLPTVTALGGAGANAGAGGIAEETYEF